MKEVKLCNCGHSIFEHGHVDTTFGSKPSQRKWVKQGLGQCLNSTGCNCTSYKDGSTGFIVQ